jgi:hypothetical protein
MRAHSNSSENVGFGDPGSIEELKSIYRDHPDAGMHAAAEWILRK